MIGAEEIRPGIVHHVSQDEILGSVGPRVVASQDGGETWSTLCELPFSQPRRSLSYSPVLRRYARALVYHLLPVDESTLLAIGARQIFCIDRAKGRVRSTEPLVGSHPLAVCTAGQRIYYGVYSVAPGDEESRILCSNDGGASWETAATVPGVRHIHGIFTDPYADALWVTTGDADDESWLLRCTPDFARIEKVLGGSQDRRIVQPVFTEDAIYFGSDSPHLDNQIYRFDRASGDIEAQVSVGNSVFFGTKVADEVFFGTAIEPSWRRHDRRVRLWHRGPRSWKPIWSAARPLALSWLCYPRILFPAGAGDESHVWWSALGTRNDQRMCRLPLEAVHEAAENVP